MKRDHKKLLTEPKVEKFVLANKYQSKGWSTFFFNTFFFGADLWTRELFFFFFFLAVVYSSNFSLIKGNPSCPPRGPAEMKRERISKYLYVCDASNNHGYVVNKGWCDSRASAKLALVGVAGDVLMHRLVWSVPPLISSWQGHALLSWNAGK